MLRVSPKKSLGQHFLKDENIARKITTSLSGDGYEQVLEVGPGTGALTKWLVEDNRWDLSAIERDRESIAHLNEHFPELHLIEEDFLDADLHSLFSKPFAIIGNFPYNISSQILFKVLDYRDEIPEVVGMLQKEVAQRLAAPPGSKTHGILSVLMQAWYNIELLFTVGPQVFHPPPKVESAVIRMRRNEVKQLDCDEKQFKTLVKTAFNQRRKMLRNSLAKLGDLPEDPILTKRPEQLSVQDFVRLTNLIES